MDRLHKIHLIERKATWWIHMVRRETYKETKNFSSWWCVARYVEMYVRCSEKESKTKMGYRETKARPCQAIERNTLHRTKRWRIQAHNQSRSEKVGSSDASSNALQNTDKEQWENPPQYWETQDKYACIVDADENTRTRLEGAVHKHHQDHITAKRVNSITHYSLVHKFILMPQALKNSRCKGGSGKEWEKLEKIPAWDLTKVINKKEVIDEARNEGTKVHFASLMDLCHLKNSELEPTVSKVQRQSRTLKWNCKKMIQVRMQCSLNKDRQRPKWQPQKSWTLYPDFQDVQVKQLMQYPLIRRSKWKMHQFFF